MKSENIETYVHRIYVPHEDRVILNRAAGVDDMSRVWRRPNPMPETGAVQTGYRENAGNHVVYWMYESEWAALPKRMRTAILQSRKVCEYSWGWHDPVCDVLMGITL